MKHSIAAAAACLALGAATLAPAAHAEEACTQPDPTLLRTTWQAFRVAALAGRPEEVGKFYRFPLQLLGPYHDDPPLTVTRAGFTAHYNLIFRQFWDGVDTPLYAALKQSTGNEYIGLPHFDVQRCAYIGAARVMDHEFAYDRKTGWKVAAVYLTEEYPLLRDEGLDGVQSQRKPRKR